MRKKDVTSFYNNGNGFGSMYNANNERVGYGVSNGEHTFLYDNDGNYRGELVHNQWFNENMETEGFVNVNSDDY